MFLILRLIINESYADFQWKWHQLIRFVRYFFCCHFVDLFCLPIFLLANIVIVISFTFYECKGKKNAHNFRFDDTKKNLVTIYVQQFRQCIYMCIWAWPKYTVANERTLNQTIRVYAKCILFSMHSLLFGIVYFGE